jgi:hypothetical protein
MGRLVAEVQERATHRRASSLYGIGAAVDRELRRSERAGRTWLCAITDTVNGVRWIEVHGPGFAAGERVDEDTIERFVEREAGFFPIESRLDDLAAASPLRIELFLADAA